ncbi:sigma-70 family RNA polymerase sigma factor, partial [Clostridium perfringens]
FNSYDVEDNKQDLIVSLINIVNKIPIDNPQFENEGCLVNYIYKSILNSRKDMYINKNIKRYFIESQSLSSMVEFKDKP